MGTAGQGNSKARICSQEWVTCIYDFGGEVVSRGTGSICNCGSQWYRTKEVTGDKVVRISGAWEFPSQVPKWCGYSDPRTTLWDHGCNGRPVTSVAMKTGMRMQSKFIPTIFQRMSGSGLMGRGLGSIHSKCNQLDTRGLSPFSLGVGWESGLDLNGVSLISEYISINPEIFTMGPSTEQCCLVNWRIFLLSPVELRTGLKLHCSGIVGGWIVKSQQWYNQASGSTKK